MTVGSALVAIAFGLLVGWGLRTRDFDRRPAVAAPVVGLAAGAVTLGLSLGDNPELAGGSLLLGCAAILTALLIPPRR
ncbi:MAG: hypothetical protein ACLFWM_04500 [Actinomycetota bacterium]